MQVSSFIEVARSARATSKTPCGFRFSRRKRPLRIHDPGARRPPEVDGLPRRHAQGLRRPSREGRQVEAGREGHARRDRRGRRAEGACGAELHVGLRKMLAQLDTTTLKVEVLAAVGGLPKGSRRPAFLAASGRGRHEGPQERSRQDETTLDVFFSRRLPRFPASPQEQAPRVHTQGTSREGRLRGGLVAGREGQDSKGEEGRAWAPAAFWGVLETAKI